jgi:hypothetical protein
MQATIKCPKCDTEVIYETSDLKTPTNSKLARCVNGHDLWLQVDSGGLVTAQECPT